MHASTRWLFLAHLRRAAVHVSCGRSQGGALAAGHAPRVPPCSISPALPSPPTTSPPCPRPAPPGAAGLKNAVRSAWAGLAAGCLHTLAGADHLAALTPLTIGRSHLKASLLGALWGFGHSTGQLILGLLMVLLKDRFQQASTSASAAAVAQRGAGVCARPSTAAEGRRRRAPTLSPPPHSPTHPRTPTHRFSSMARATLHGARPSPHLTPSPTPPTPHPRVAAARACAVQVGRRHRGCHAAGHRCHGAV